MYRRVVDILNNCNKTAFSFEVLPPLKGHDIDRVYKIIDKLIEFDPKYINITTHHSEYVYRQEGDGNIRRINMRKRPGTVAVAASIQNKYKVKTIPHIICKGFTKAETEYALIDLNFLGIHDLLVLRGDTKNIDSSQLEECHEHATDMIGQINDFNKGIYLDGSKFEKMKTPFSYGVACYPEKHEEAPNLESDIHYLKKKIELGADYAVTQMFFDNEKYFSFVKKCREKEINVPIIPGIKPIVQRKQLTDLPKIFRSEIPEELAEEIIKCKNDEEVREVGIEWGIRQCRELIARRVPSIHFYSLLASESVRRIAKEIY